MRVNRTDIVLRERRFWESLDVAGPMYRRWLGPIAIFFGIPFAVMISALVVAAFGVANTHVPVWVPALAVWWLKPLWDRLVMVPAGVLMFDRAAGFNAMAGTLRRVLSGSLAADLTWRRFSPLRAYLLPVSMYERPREGAKRKRALRRGTVGKLIGATALFLALEAIVGSSLLLTFRALSSVGVIAFAAAAPVDPRLLYTLIYAVVVGCVEPFYVLSCFSLYVNRRTSAEGWDLQLAFLRLRSKFPTAGGKILVFGFALLLSLQAAHLNGQSSRPTPKRAQQSAFVARAHQVLAGSEFGRTIVRRELRLKKKMDVNGLFRLRGGNPFLNRLGAEALRVIAIGIALALVTLGIVANRRRISLLARSLRRRERSLVHNAPAVDGEPLGPDWIDAGRRAWESGSFREALGILYRGSLSLARSRYNIVLAESATERECLRVLRDSSAAPGFVRAVEEVTGSWIRLAWAGRVPGALEFDDLCRTLTELGRAE